jgi:hypothetical protein
MDERVSHTPTGEQAYALIASTYGLPLKASTFVRVLLDGRGHADMLACHLMEWCLDWYRPTEGDGRRYRGEAPYLDSAGLAESWNVSWRPFKTARTTISRAGLVTFRSCRHQSCIEIHWAAVAEAVRREAEFRGVENTDFRGAKNGPSDFRGAKNGPSKSLEGPKTARLKGLEGPKTAHTLLMPSSLSPSSFGEGGGGGVENSIQVEVCDISAAVERCLEFGRSRGRRCNGRWVENARTAFAAAVTEGRDPSAIEGAWCGYVSRRGADATDLGHWIRGQNLRGEPSDEGEDSFEVCYTHAEKEAWRAAERARVEAGEAPTPDLRHGPEGWFARAEGMPMQPYDAVPPDASYDEALAAWPGWYQAQRGGV